MTISDGLINRYRNGLTVSNFFCFAVEKFELKIPTFEKVHDFVDDQRVQTGVVVGVGGPSRRRILDHVVLGRGRVFDQPDAVEQFHFRLFVDPVEGRQ